MGHKYQWMSEKQEALFAKDLKKHIYGPRKAWRDQQIAEIQKARKEKEMNLRVATGWSDKKVKTFCQTFTKEQLKRINELAA